MEGVFEAFIALFVIMDPIGNLPLIFSLTKGMPAREIRKNVDKAIFVAGLLIFVFIFLGLKIFEIFRININSFQIAGGIILFIMGLLYVFGISTKFVKASVNDFTVPVGTPLLTGPGVIATTIILVNEVGIFVTVIAAFMTLIATYLIFINFSKIYKMLGENWTNVISRIMGIILAAIAVEFIANGAIEIISPLLY